MNLQPGKKIYFISDFHLGVPNDKDSRKREDKIVTWLNSIHHDVQILYLMGDVFDYWFEYKEVVPRGYVRLLGKLAELSDAGVEMHYFTGNHDMWVFDYLPKEIGLQIHRAPIQKEYNNKKFFLGHGDGLGPGDFGYKFIKKVFANKLAQWFFARVHPNTGIGLMKFFSRKSRIATGTSDEVYLGDDKEWLMIFCREVLQKEHYDYFIFGHRHMPLDKQLNGQSRYINLGEWINHFTYAVFDGQELLLKKFES
ncbi:MAG: UDP-2,3-diacylglucosamine diphosphatase [Bacteroidota bacterium]